MLRPTNPQGYLLCSAFFASLEAAHISLSCGSWPFSRPLAFCLHYELFRRQTSRIVAASICLLLISSRIFFLMATQWVFPSYPYFFTSMAALLVARKFQNTTTLRARLVWGALLTLLISASLMFASAGIALLCAIVASTAVLFFRNRERAFARVKLYAAVFLIAAAVQGFWMHRKASTLEWPIPGYPQSYLSQLKVKSGNQPELGMATLSDIPRRILRNAADDSVMLSQALLRRWVDVAWMSALVTGPIASDSARMGHFRMAYGWNHPGLVFRRLPGSLSSLAVEY